MSLARPTAAFIPHSLLISHNLDALLEHEERRRAQTASVELRTPQSSSPQSIVEFPTGLLPPPRRSGGRKSPRSPLSRAGTPQRNSPELEAASSTSNPYINPAPTLTLEEALWSSGKSRRDGSGQPWTAKNIDFEEEIESFAAVKMNGEYESASPWRPRPLISHGRRSSISSSDSASTHGPPSTVEHEPRISISSTLYPASSSHSFPHSLYNDPADMATQYRSEFMDIYSPTNPEFHNSDDNRRISPIHFLAGSPASESGRRSTSPKPPIATTPQPMFTRSGLASSQSSPRMSPTTPKFPLPPTANFLDLDERADLVRKSRKLARMFGKTPGAEAMAHQSTNTFLMSRPPRPNGIPAFDDTPRRSAPRGLPDALNISNPRRHSLPLSPDEFSFLSITSPLFETTPSKAEFQPLLDATPSSLIPIGQENVISSDLSCHATPHRIRPRSSNTSFMDLSDDDASPPARPRPIRLPAKPPAPISPTQSETMSIISVEDKIEDERRRKRERLAKLHRFLGSRVPVNLVLGFDDTESSLPPPQLSGRKASAPEIQDNSRKAWVKRRRSSSAVTPPSHWFEELERVKEELDEKEKAINVRRAQKMEKVFGVAPPQTLYHTRHCPPPITASSPSVLPPLTLISPMYPLAQTFQRSPTAYSKTKTKKNNRPGTSESNKQLLQKGNSNYGGFDERTTALETRPSLIYNHYQHSLNSLNDIIDRDDRESLAELHQYLNSAEFPSSPPEEDLPIPTRERRPSNASTIKSERRRSLPTRTSMMSLTASEFDTPKADVTTFQVRRRRAAKLTQFFGVNYRELISDVLESIENGVEHEQLRGTLRAEEVELLRSKLRNLKTKRQSIF